MKLKTSELTGAALDRAVAKCKFGNIPICNPFWSTDWGAGGLIIEKERIATWFEHYDDEDAGLPCWFAAKYCEREYPGPTPLIAAMRCYVASRVGDEIELPEELKEVMA